MFVDKMREMRRIDDNIMLRLNATDTHSKESCAGFFKQLADAYTKRQHAIDTCLQVSMRRDGVSQLGRRNHAN